ncbi:MAG: tRNA pseudouridine(13) synthase TruD, partial [Planctomycetota bacterium]
MSGRNDGPEGERGAGEDGGGHAAPGTLNAPPAFHPAVGFALPADWITLGPDAPRFDPRPGPRASTEPGIGGRLKERAEDFIVEELPLYVPSGEGEHLYLRIVKEGVSHHEMVDALCAHFGVGPEAIGHAG